MGALRGLLIWGSGANWKTGHKGALVVWHSGMAWMKDEALFGMWMASYLAIYSLKLRELCFLRYLFRYV